jgi:hypothetical protein
VACLTVDVALVVRLKSKANSVGGRSLANETINPDGHCRRLVDKVSEADVRPKTKVGLWHNLL